ncbi:helix-turn-helix domain-containing protein [Aphanothece sacrum]|uniref:Transcriptional regulator n=1 Tax=Aphanothece sacrum FPU1 TaxID=1920663 RepID=A0A401IN96_APHSA|nr:helix-turn-helix domain-containing protein [Aphanothece sacrum]GBF82717.1 transcriptional regulator [Aphanothece sacrum FPU1]GBF84492.1 transcriptional regulator [Aphanothece sacrum FPU3]
MEYVGTTQAAGLLGICQQRVRQLLAEGRIKGAFKKGRFWRIPLYNEMPQIIPGKRGPKGTWRKRPQRVATYIHVNQKILQRNIHQKNPEPAISIHRGNRTIQCHQVDIRGGCKVIYSPEKPKNCGARVWIEVDPSVEVIGTVFASA